MIQSQNKKQIRLSFKRKKRMSIGQTSPNINKNQRNHVDPIKQEALLNRAKYQYHSNRNIEQAAQLFQQFLTLVPRHNEALYLCGVCFLHLDKYQKAIEKFSNVSDDYYQFNNVLLFIAIAYKKMELLEKSFEAVNKCLNMFSLFQEAICFRGKLYMEVDKCNKAQNDFISVLKLSNTSFTAMIGLGECYHKQNRLLEALTMYKQSLQTLKQSGLNETTLQNDVTLKIGILLYNLQKWQQSLHILTTLSKVQQMRTTQLFYYIGKNELNLNCKSNAIINLQYSLILNTNKAIAEKAYKKIILLYLQNNQFYEAENIVHIGRLNEITVQLWILMIESFMLIIKHKWEEGLNGLNSIYELLHENNKKQYGKIHENKDIFDNIIMNNKAARKGKRNNILSPKRKDSQEIPKYSRKLSLLSSKQAKKMNYIESTRLVNSLQLKIKDKQFRTEPNVKEDILQLDNSTCFSKKQREIIYPMVLKFKAYAQFFANKIFRSYESFDEYQVYLKDYLGRQSDVSYSKTICQGILLVQNQQENQALIKFTKAIQMHYNTEGILQAEPLFYKIAVIVRMAIQAHINSQLQLQRSEQFMQTIEQTLQMIQSYDQTIENHFTTNYYKGLIYILMDKVEDSQKCFQAAIKQTDDYKWKLLYFKGVVEMKLGNYQIAIKEFSAGFIIQQRQQFYFARSICFYILSTMTITSDDENLLRKLLKSIIFKIQPDNSHYLKKDNEIESIQTIKQLLSERCIEDLNKYIEISFPTLNSIIWISKLLYVNGKFDQVIKNLEDVDVIKNCQLIKMTQSISILDGNFQGGGEIGLIIKSAFDGDFFTPQEQKKLLKVDKIKYYSGLEESINPEYEKWLIILQLYIKQEYLLLIQYIQKQLLQVEQEETEIYLRFNLAMIYYIIDECDKGNVEIRQSRKFQNKFDVKNIFDKILFLQYEDDECLDEIYQPNSSHKKNLSNFLPYKPIYLQNSNKKRLYIKINIPFCELYRPNLQVGFNFAFIMQQFDVNLIEKKMEPPWIKKINKRVQFTEILSDSLTNISQTSNSLSVSCFTSENQAQQ